MSQAAHPDSRVRHYWHDYKASDSYRNTRRWALVGATHVDGSLWAAFNAGWEMAQTEAFLVKNLEGAVEIEEECYFGGK